MEATHTYFLKSVTEIAFSEYQTKHDMSPFKKSSLWKVLIPPELQINSYRKGISLWACACFVCFELENAWPTWFWDESCGKTTKNRNY